MIQKLVFAKMTSRRRCSFDGGESLSISGSNGDGDDDYDGDHDDGNDDDGDDEFAMISTTNFPYKISSLSEFSKSLFHNVLSSIADNHVC